MFADIDFMKLQMILRSDTRFSVEIYVASNVFDSKLRTIGVDGDEKHVQLEGDRRMSSVELSKWIDEYNIEESQ